MERVGEARLLGDLLDHRARQLQLLGGVIYFQPQQQPVGRLMVVLLEQPAQVSHVQMTFARRLIQRMQPEKMLADKIPAVLVSGKGQRLAAGQRRARLQESSASVPPPAGRRFPASAACRAARSGSARRTTAGFPLAEKRAPRCRCGARRRPAAAPRRCRQNSQSISPAAGADG